MTQQPNQQPRPQGGPQQQPNQPPSFQQPQHSQQTQSQAGAQQTYQQQAPQGFQQQAPQGFQQQPYHQQGQQGFQQQPFQQQGACQAQLAQKQNRRGTAIIAGVLALILVIGGGYLAYNFFTRGAQLAAAKAMPADVAGMIEINLAPSIQDQLALKEFIEKFPSLSEDVADMGDNYKKALWDTFVNTTGDPDVPDFSEVEPFLGDSLALGLRANSTPIVVVDVTDEDKARAFFKQEASEMNVSVGDGWAVITDPSDPVEVSDAVDNALADNEMFKQDISKLSGNPLATAWFGPELAQLSEDISGEMGVNIPETHGAFGLTVEGGVAQLQGSIFSEEITSANDDSVNDYITSLPSAPIVAGITLSEQTVNEIYAAISEDSSMGNMAAEMGIESAEDLRDILGSRIGLVADIGDNDVKFALAVQTDDPERHVDFVRQLLSQGLSMGSTSPQTEIIDGIAYTTYGMSAQEVANPSSKLGDNQAYTQVMPDGEANQMVFVDVASLLERYSGASDPTLEDLRQITGVAITGVDLDDNRTEVLIRVGTK